LLFGTLWTAGQGVAAARAKDRMASHMLTTTGD
jgi:hypothetical protein